MAVNLGTQILLARGIAPAMIAARSGEIINIQSQTGDTALEDHATHAASNGGLNVRMTSLLTGVASHNIQVNAICPTVVMTEIRKNSGTQTRNPGR